MTRQPLIIALAAGLIILLSTVNLLAHRFPETLYFPWQAIPAAGLFPNFLPPGRDGTGNDATTYLLGVGKADITGPVAEINFMGYADSAQVGTGLRQRLYSRAFIIGDIAKPQDRFVYLVLDTQSGDTAIRYGILKALEALGDDYSHYGQSNVAVTGTHSHSGPGAWLNYLLPQITSLGFHLPSYQAIVDGAVASIVKAHESLAPGTLSIGDIELADANVNRSPYAYLQNPAEERERYAYDVDKTLTALRFKHQGEDADRDIGILTWFPVHGTSMQGNNTLVTGDNKGVAAWLFERSMPEDTYVAGFSQANVGDTSPNVLGAYCESGEQEGQLCDFKTSLCANKTQPCHGRGPHYGRNDAGTASTFEIGRRQFQAARDLFGDDSAFTRVRGNVVRSLHQFVDMSDYHFQLPNGTEVHTCPAAMGYSFAAGTSDGPGKFDFKQGQPDDPHASPLWNVIRNRIHTPNDTQKACHGVKPILLDVGESHKPYDWTPNIVDMQVLRVGQLFIIVAPGEATTMAGRRWKEAVTRAATLTFEEFDEDSVKPLAVLGGPANTYAHYITTTEEYSVQRYEGASTLYGPFTLDAYINLTVSRLGHLARKSTLPRLSQGPDPPILVNDSLSFIRPVILDRAPIFKSFGDIRTDVEPSYFVGDSVSAIFVGASPRNNLKLGKTFAAVERLDDKSGTWQRVRDDSDWGLVFEWKRTSTTTGTSDVTVRWETMWETDDWKGELLDSLPPGHGELLKRRDSLKGLYRLKYYGDAKSLGGSIQSFQGTSGEFRLV